MQAFMPVALLAIAAGLGGVAYAQQTTINDYVRQMVLQARDLSVRNQASEIMVVELPQQKSAMFAFPLDPKKPYRILSACDDDCLDLDLIAYGPDGKVIAHDEEKDSGPALEIRPGASGDVVRVLVGMATCETDSCVAGLGLFELDK